METPDRITDEAALAEAIKASVGDITKDVKQQVGGLANEYTKYRRWQRLSILVLASAFLLPNLLIFILEILLAGLVPVWSGIINFFIFLFSIVFLGYFGLTLLFAGTAQIRRFHGSVDHVLFAKTFDLLKVQGKLIEHSVALDERPPATTRFQALKDRVLMYVRTHEQSKDAKAALALLKQSELITDPFNVSQVDNLFEVAINGAMLHGAELDIKHITGSGKNRHVKNIFKGYFVSYELPHTLDGKTFVSTEGDEYGFGHRTFWSAVGEQGAAETTLEWNDFEALLHVATTDRVEARYILTPRFMSDLYDWWKTKSSNIRISFIGNRLCLLFPDHQVRLDDSVDQLNEAEIETYMLTIAKPMLHVIRLIEGVRMS